jgi:hypothetical protein
MPVMPRVAARLAVCCLVAYVLGVMGMSMTSLPEWRWSLASSRTTIAVPSCPDKPQRQLMNLSSAALAPHYQPAASTPDPGRIYLTGYRQTALASAIYPGVSQECYVDAAQASTNDILIVGMHGPPGTCSGDVSTFPGNVLYYNAEPSGRLSAHQLARKNVYYLGPLAIENENSHEMQGLLVAIKGIVPFLESEGLEALLNSERLHCSNGAHFMAYAQTKCQAHRERAFAWIADARQSMGLELPTALGKCYGKRPATKLAVRTARVHSLYAEAGQTSNAESFSQYRFVLAMENSNAAGYISEKLFIAFSSGAIPVYWGTVEVFDVFNRDAFIFYDANNPQRALDQLHYLESNRTAYAEMQARPYLAQGAETVKKYFSYTDNVAGGLKQRIRKMLWRSSSDSPE